MGRYVEGVDRRQSLLVPECVNDYADVDTHTPGGGAIIAHAAPSARGVTSVRPPWCRRGRAVGQGDLDQAQGRDPRFSLRQLNPGGGCLLRNQLHTVASTR
jgi:hypothetical protein